MRKRRLILRIGLCLFLGAITTVAVAWGLPFIMPQNISDATPTSESGSFAKRIMKSHNWNRGGAIIRSTYVGWYVTEVVGSLADDFQRVNSHPNVPADATNIRLYPEHQFGYVESGLPLKCFEGSIHRRFDTTRETVESDWAICVESQNSRIEGAIPLKPRLIPFAINTAFYGLLAMLSTLVITRIGRSRWRKKHGLCPSCGYDLRGRPDAGCPECGWRRVEEAG